MRQLKCNVVYVTQIQAGKELSRHILTRLHKTHQKGCVHASCSHGRGKTCTWPITMEQTSDGACHQSRVGSNYTIVHVPYLDLLCFNYKKISRSFTFEFLIVLCHIEHRFDSISALLGLEGKMVEGVATRAPIHQEEKYLNCVYLEWLFPLN